jgi:hypothetical protein
MRIAHLSSIVQLDVTFTTIDEHKCGRWDNTVENSRRAISRESLVAIDAYTSKLFGMNPDKFKQTNLAARVFGTSPQEIIMEADNERMLLEQK